MELLDAIEELEGGAPAASPSRYDFVEQQVLFVQQRLREFRQRKYGDTVKPPMIPFYWVFSKLLRLIEEYPDGLTEAVVVTELATLLQLRETGDSEQEIGKPRKRRKVRDEGEMTDFLEEWEQKALGAKIVGYENHRLTIEMENVKDMTAYMYLHQRFRSCMEFLHTQLQYEPNSAGIFPFQPGRVIAFTNAKLLERKDVDTRVENNNGRARFTFLPTPLLTARLDRQWPLDRRLLADSISLSRVDHLVATHSAPEVIQQLMVKAKVLDIGAIRPCQTPLYVHRQVIILGEVGTGTFNGTKSQTQGMAQSHVMVLWDDQVALSRLFRVGDILLIFHPFVHVCEPSDSEIIHIMSEYSSQQRCAYYFECGSATVLFCQPSRVSDAGNDVEASAVRPSQVTNQEQPLSCIETIRAGWHNFSLYAHVRSIKVSHGIPLLAAFFYAYYDPKTNQQGGNTATMEPPPALDRTIVSKFYLVVMLQVYIASSNQLLVVEVTGTNAFAALRLQPGQSVFLNGLVTVDIRRDPVRKFRQRGRMHFASAPASQAAEFAFPTNAYSSSGSSSTVALCSDWENIFGKQSVFSNSSKLTLVNSMPGLVNTTLEQRIVFATSQNVGNQAITIVEMTVLAAGWLIPNGMQAFTYDTTCKRGYSTICAHKSCQRQLDMVPNQQTTSGPPKWKCTFCNELFFGMEDTVQTFRELAVTLENGTSQNCPLVVLCKGETVERLLGITADNYPQMRITEKCKALRRVVGNGFRLVLSRCEPRSVAMVKSSLEGAVGEQSATRTITVNARMDLVQPVDTLVAAHERLAALKSRR